VLSVGIVLVLNVVEQFVAAGLLFDVLVFRVGDCLFGLLQPLQAVHFVLAHLVNV
jgi:hypothetical protein